MDGPPFIGIFVGHPDAGFRRIYQHGRAEHVCDPPPRWTSACQEFCSSGSFHGDGRLRRQRFSAHRLHDNP